MTFLIQYLVTIKIPDVGLISSIVIFGAIVEAMLIADPPRSMIEVLSPRSGWSVIETLPVKPVVASTLDMLDDSSQETTEKKIV